METKKQCYRCKELKDISSFYIINKTKIYSYCKPCTLDYLIEKYGSLSNYYAHVKSQHPIINCECGKTISRPYHMKKHLETKYHTSRINN